MAERPEYLTVPEVMARLRLGRTTVYEQARLFLATDGAEGIPCRRFGRSLRFPVAAIDPAGGEVATHNGTDHVDPSGDCKRTTTPPHEPRSPSARRRTRTARRPRGDDQSTLPFTR